MINTISQSQFGYSRPNLEKKRKQASFQSSELNQVTIPLSNKNEEEKKPTSKVKLATNVLAAAAWVGIVGYSIYKLKLLNPKSPEKIAEKAKSKIKQAQSAVENLADTESNNIGKALEGQKFKSIRKAFYNVGNWFQNVKMRVGGELFNNLLYAFGTMIVMPTVVLLSPTKKDGTTKEDKLFTILRQPISVAATLGMQFTFDKLIDKYVPEVMKQNHLEDASILDTNKKIKLEENGTFLKENFEKIKYNVESVKEGFKKLFNPEKGELKGILDDKELSTLFTLRSFDEDSADVVKEKLKDILNDKFKSLKLKDFEDLENLNNIKSLDAAEKTNVEKLLTAFKKVTTVMDNNKIAVQKSKTMVNVLAASAIGCTFLNLVYGKMMKARDEGKERKLKLAQEKSKEVK